MRDARVTKQELLAAIDAVARTRAPAVTRGFRPGRGIAAVRAAVAKLTEEPCRAGDLSVPLILALAAHEPWDEIPYDLLEPLFDAVRVLARFSESRRPVEVPIEASDVVVRHGDVRVRGDLEIRGALLVTGSLHVTGAIRNMGDEWYSGTLVVLGDVRAPRMLCLGPTAIGGTLALAQGLMTAYYHDTDSSLVARAIETPVWVELGDISGRVRGKRTVAHHLHHQAWIAKRLSRYFDGTSRRLAWPEYDAAFFRAARRAASRS